MSQGRQHRLRRSGPGAHCEGGIVQREREAEIFDGVDWLDTKAALPGLTQTEEERFSELVAKAKARVEDECDAARLEYAEESALEQLGRTPTVLEIEKISGPKETRRDRRQPLGYHPPGHL